QVIAGFSPPRGLRKLGGIDAVQPYLELAGLIRMLPTKDMQGITIVDFDHSAVFQSLGAF
ncbi:MAG: hypothetical protein ACREX4_18035, partial [Gammaproteobacteria bacterium]